MHCDLCRTLPVPRLYLFHSRKKAKRLFDRMGWKFDPLDSDAQTWAIHRGSEMYAVVLIEESNDDQADAALLAHEAVHVTKSTLDIIGEDDAGEETFAYLIQAVTESLLAAHAKWKARKASE